MIRSMSSAISGMRNHQLMLDVVSSDISNVSTIGFKSSNILFSDVLSQTLQAGDPQGVVAGTNPAQVGLGSRLAGTAQNFAQGALQRTGRTTASSSSTTPTPSSTPVTGRSRSTRRATCRPPTVGTSWAGRPTRTA